MAGCVDTNHSSPTDSTANSPDYHQPSSSTTRTEDVPKNRIDANNTLWVPIQNVNQYITCGICHGYLYEASTITECMHSFCKNCIVKHVERSLQCPTCRILIHPTDPFVHIRLDRLLQDIVYGLLPNLAEDELLKEKQFYAEYDSKRYPGHRSAAGSSQHQRAISTCNSASKPAAHSRALIPVVSLVLQCRCTSQVEKKLQKGFVRVTGKATIRSVAAFLRKKLLIDDDYQVDIYCFCESGCISLDTHKTLHDIKEQYCKHQEYLQLEYDVSQKGRSD